MVTFITVIHIVLCFFLIVVVLLQSGKGADMGAAFGGASQTVFGATGALTLLHKVTTVTAVMFMFTSLLLAWNSAREQAGGGGLDSGIFDQERQDAETEPEATEPAPVEEGEPGGADEAPAVDAEAPGDEAPADEISLEQEPAAEEPSDEGPSGAEAETTD